MHQVDRRGSVVPFFGIDVEADTTCDNDRTGTRSNYKGDVHVIIFNSELGGNPIVLFVMRRGGALCGRNGKRVLSD